jgi:hypothetical protein
VHQASHDFQAFRPVNCAFEQNLEPIKDLFCVGDRADCELRVRPVDTRLDELPD